MKYAQPYGVSDPDAGYVNGNPSTGTMGSIPPAASIEQPQRELHNFIADSRLVPDAADLHQLGKGIQNNGVVYCEDQGTLNQLVITLAPNVTALVPGMVFIVRSPRSNTGPATLKVNSLAPVPIVRATDQAPLDLGDISAWALLAYGFDGAKFQMVWSQRQPGAPIYLVAPRVYYVNAATGNDTFDGQAAAVGNGHGPYQTIQKAADQIGLYNMNKWSITINVADGTYAQFRVPAINGAGYVFFNGNISNPGAVWVKGTTASAILCMAEGYCFFNGFKVSNTGAETPGDWCCGVYAGGPGTICYLESMEFGQCVGPQIGVGRGASVGNTDPHSPWKVSGGGASFVRAFGGSIGRNASAGPDVFFTAGFNYTTAFCHAGYNASTLLIWGATSGAYASCTGMRYAASENSTISVSGGGPNYYPGTIAGILSTGGQYA
jgi:hypothetical protein